MIQFEYRIKNNIIQFTAGTGWDYSIALLINKKELTIIIFGLGFSLGYM